jgi:hypothetical protein
MEKCIKFLIYLPLDPSSGKKKGKIQRTRGKGQNIRKKEGKKEGQNKEGWEGWGSYKPTTSEWEGSASHNYLQVYDPSHS